MPITPTPPTIVVDLPSEYLEFLDTAALARGTTPQVIMRDALAMLQPEVWSNAMAIADHRMASEEKKVDPHLAAWDRWRGNSRNNLPLTGDAAEFVARQLTDGGYPDATAVVMLALLRYAKLMGFGFDDDREDSLPD
jgi:hypothetical protein